MENKSAHPQHIDFVEESTTSIHPTAMNYLNIPKVQGHVSNYSMSSQMNPMASAIM